MLTLKVSTLILFVILLGLPVSETKGWRGIIPLKSNRADVERLLGQPTEPDEYGVLYKLEEEIVFIEYSSGFCNKDREGGWNVARDTVVSIDITPKKKLLITDLKLDASYRKSPGGDTTSVVHYTNRQDGIMYAVDDATGIIRTISFQPGIENKHLLCPRSTDN